MVSKLKGTKVPWVNSWFQGLEEKMCKMSLGYLVVLESKEEVQEYSSQVKKSQGPTWMTSC